LAQPRIQCMIFGVLSEETGCTENAPVSKFVAPGA